MDQIKERCIYCGSDVYYTGTETLIKCDKCGNTLVVAKFENELARMNAAIEEGEAAKRELEEARHEKQAADDRLFAALLDFDALKDGQNAALRVLYALSDGQESASEKLDLLKHFSGRILETQDDIMGKLQMQTEIAAHLQTIEMDTDHRNQMLSDFMLWCQTARAEDMKALEDLSSSASALLEGQKVIDEKVERLQQTVDQTQQTIVSFQSEYQSDKINELRRLFEQASEDQIDRAYDKAMDKYEQAIVKGGPDPEILWRMILCHYCISYQQDGDGDMIPIILNPDLKDPDELKVRREFSKQVLEGSNTSAEERRVYTDELIKIDQILDNYRQVRHDWQFDVFISVKQSSDGQYTPDRNVGLDLYDFLTSKGLRVFNSERTELPAGELYEPYIISALLSSKVMIVVGTCAENMESQWVKNEWSRFQWLQYHEKKQTGKTDRVLLCYLAKGMQPVDIPRALDPDRQAIVEGVNSARILLSALHSILPQGKKTEKKIPINGTQDISDGSAIQTKEPLEQVLTQMTVMLTLGEYKQVIEKHTQLRFTAPYMSDPRFHLYALCAEKQVDEIGRLSELKTDLNKERLFKLAMKFSKDTDLQMYLENLTQENNESLQNNQICKVEADPGHVDDVNPDFQYRQGLRYQNGDGVRKDEAEAVNWFRKAAENGDGRAQCELGECYLHGRGIERNTDEAIKWFQKAAEQGNASAQFNLGECYAFGSGVSQNYKKAFQWFLKAAEQGDGRAQSYLGNYYQHGTGVKQDLNEAVRWYRKAADQGNEWAQTCLESLLNWLEKQKNTRDEAEHLVSGNAAVAHPSRTQNGKILDSWGEIIENIHNNTYKEKYRIGDVKEIDLGPEGVIPMILAAFNEDELADGSGKAPTTWIAGAALKSKHRMNPEFIEGHEGTGAIGGWEKSEMRSYLERTIRSLMPEKVSLSLCLVKKNSYYPTGPFANRTYGQTTADDLWIPSRWEVRLDDALGERGGSSYPEIFDFDDDTSRIRKSSESSNNIWWWLRSAYGHDSFHGVGRNGEGCKFIAYIPGSVVLGFCL